MKYRDTKTGKFVSASTWRRSRAHGGTRYRRVNRTGPRNVLLAGKKPTMSPTAPPSRKQVQLANQFREITGRIPAEFLIDEDDYFESGYESDEEDEYP